MKAVVKSDRIELKHLFYAIIFPKGSEELAILDNSGVGLYNVLLRIKSENQRIESPLGKIIGLFFYKIDLFLVILSRAYSLQTLYNNEPNIINNTKDIEMFLSDLKNNGYNIQETEKQFDLIKHKAYNKKTHRALWVFVFFIFVLIIISLLDNIF